MLKYNGKIYNNIRCGNNIVYKIYNYLYKNCGDLYLTRKEEKFDKIELKIKK